MREYVYLIGSILGLGLALSIYFNVNAIRKTYPVLKSFERHSYNPTEAVQIHRGLAERVSEQSSGLRLIHKLNSPGREIAYRYFLHTHQN